MRKKCAVWGEMARRLDSFLDQESNTPHIMILMVARLTKIRGESSFADFRTVVECLAFQTLLYCFVLFQMSTV